MNRKHLCKLGCIVSSSLMLVQFAPMAFAQSGNMSDATGGIVTTGNGGGYGGNMSDGSGVNILSDLIIKLQTSSLIAINGQVISAELQQALIKLLIGQSTDINILVKVLVQNGIPLELAQNLAKNFQGLILADGKINQAQLLKLILSYRAILEVASLDFLLNPPIEFLALQAILVQLDASTDFAFFTNTNGNASLIALLKLLSSNSFSFSGGSISAEFQLALLNLLLGRSNGIGQLVSILVKGGIPANLAQELAQSLRGLLLANGTLNQSQLTLVIKAYQAIIANAGGNFLNNPSVEFLALRAILIQLGIDGSLLAFNPPGGGGTGQPGGGGTGQPGGGNGNMSDATGGNVNSGDVAGKPDKDKDKGKGNMSDGTGVIVTTSDGKGNMSDATGVIVTTSDGKETLEDTPPVPQTVSTGSDNNSNQGAGIIFIASYLGGPFKFANGKIRQAILKIAQQVVAELQADTTLTIGKFVVSVEAKQIVLNVLIAQNEGTGTGEFVETCTKSGVAGNLAQNLAKSMNGLIKLNAKGEVSDVDATKLLAALGSYNAIIDASSVEMLANQPGTIQVVRFSLSQMVEAGVMAAGENQTAAVAEPVPQ